MTETTTLQAVIMAVAGVVGIVASCIVGREMYFALLYRCWSDAVMLGAYLLAGSVATTLAFRYVVSHVQ